MTYHLPVMSKEVASWLVTDEQGIYVDCTLGGGGHSEFFLERHPGIKVIGIDRDDEALAESAGRLSRFGERFRALKGNFKDISSIIDVTVAGFLLDLGISSHQVDEAARGFSFRSPNLDMRMDRSAGVTAEEVVNTAPEEELARIFYEYGEERFSRQIAMAVVEERAKARITSARRLSDIIGKVKKGRGKINPATLVFQALRIAVNGELDNLKEALDTMPSMLSRGGRIVTLSYHSLEDRIVKQSFKGLESEGRMKILTKKVIFASREEERSNPRSRSAKLRCAERTEDK